MYLLSHIFVFFYITESNSKEKKHKKHKKNNRAKDELHKLSCCLFVVDRIYWNKLGTLNLNKRNCFYPDFIVFPTPWYQWCWMWVFINQFLQCPLYHISAILPIEEMLWLWIDKNNDLSRRVYTYIFENPKYKPEWMVFNAMKIFC